MKILEWYDTMIAEGKNPVIEAAKHGLTNLALVRFTLEGGEKRYGEFVALDVFEGRAVLLTKKRGDFLSDIVEFVVLEFPWLFYAKKMVPRGSALVQPRGKQTAFEVRPKPFPDNYEEVPRPFWYEP